jgi:type III pantothenate kinase
MVEFILSLTEKSKPEIMVLSSARHFSPQVMQRLEQECGRLVVVDGEVSSRYGLPAHLTPDRVASIIASRFLFKNRGCTVFDFGTVLSVDFLDHEGNYEGGNVSPGCRTRFKALNRYTKSLPLVDTPDEIAVKGNDMKSSIETGVVSGIIFEIEGYISHHPENINVFTGGDAIYFAKRMKNSIFVVCNLVLMGLALIALEYDKKD